MTISEDIDGVVTRLTGQGIAATKSPREAINAGAVVVLVEPPERDYTTLLQTWTLTVLRVTTDLGPDTTDALSVVVAQLEESDIPLESARPGARRLSIERPPVPAYICRFTSP